MINMQNSEHLIVSAPGKVILHGEHAVVYGKTALAASLNLRTYLCLKTTADKSVSLELPDIGIEHRWEVDDLLQQFKHSLCDVHSPSSPSDDLQQTLAKVAGINPDTIDTKQLAVIAFLYTYLSICHTDGDLPGVEICLSSRLPTSAGLGSSAAFASCLVTSFLLLSGLVKSVPSSDDTGIGKYTNDALDLINRWAFISEKIIHGNPSGVDNTVSVHGGALNFQAGVIKPLDMIPSIRILLFNTKVPRSTKALVAGVRERYNKFPAIVQPILDSIEAIAKKCSELFDKVNERVSVDEAKSLQELTEMNQHLLGALGVSHPSLEQVCHTAARYKLACKLTGAGGGGCAFTMLPPDVAEPTVLGVQKDIEELGFECWETSIGGLGVVQHYSLNGAYRPPGIFLDKLHV